MTEISFEAAEYGSDRCFQSVKYRFSGDVTSGWQIYRQELPHLQLGAGYVPVQVRACGICSTDLARHHLPFALPQVIGHEVLGYVDETPVVVEINASHLALGQRVTSCPFCAAALHEHCPSRLTLGIDRLPGGFAPWLLAPRDAVLPLPKGISKAVAPLTEPLAAAMQALRVTPPQAGDRVAVLGPRRLGMLMVAALACWRDQNNLPFEITALARHSRLLSLAGMLGADNGLNTSMVPPTSLAGYYDVVYDTSGSPDGLVAALAMAKRTVHLKSTHGREVCGMNHLSEMVVDELALLPYTEANLKFNWDQESRTNAHILVTPTVDKSLLPKNKDYHFHQLPLQQAHAELSSGRFPFPCFDLAIACSCDEVDSIVRASADSNALVRPRGAVLLAGLADADSDSPLAQALHERGIQLHTSRCGAFRPALDLLAHFPLLAKVMAEDMITHHFPLQHIAEAFQMAGNSRKAIKVMVDIPP